MIIGTCIDWFFDLAWKDAKNAKPLPLPHGVHLPKNTSEGVKLFTYLKTIVRFYGQSDTPWDDEWESHIDWDFVSEWYKDVYGQKPHFSKVYWRGLLGVYMPFVDFCSNEESMNRLADTARAIREKVESECREDFA